MTYSLQDIYRLLIWKVVYACCLKYIHVHTQFYKGIVTYIVYAYCVRDICVYTPVYVYTDAYMEI